ncbi:MAG: hypothetical protein ACETWM_14640, partial [Candidatus Lokiarchaeia archaeon]
MKNKGNLLVVITLIFMISSIAIIAIPNPQPIYPHFTSNQLKTAIKSYSGSGNPINVLFYITNNHNEIPNATDTDYNIYIPRPDGWKIDWANLTLSKIIAPNITIEPNKASSNYELGDIDFYAMSFQLTNNAYLDSVSVMLDVGIGGFVRFHVYNAIDDGSGVAKPDYPINWVDVYIPQLEDYWFEVNFEHVFLNISKTFDYTFFIAIEALYFLDAEWESIVDPPTSSGYGHVYRYSGTWSNELPYDCKLRVNVSASTPPDPESAKPSEIGLTINGSPVTDIGKGQGEWIGSMETLSLFDVNSTWMAPVSFSYVWNVTYAKDEIAKTNFFVGSDSNAFWNMTIDATDAFPSTGGINYINITGIPLDWDTSNSMAYNQTGKEWIGLNSRTHNSISFPASNGIWIVNCTAPNYISNIGFHVDGVPVENATLHNKLNITVTFNTSVSGNVTLKVYDSSQILNHTEEKTID